MSVRRYDGSGLVMSREGVRGVDLWAIDEMQIPGVVLMAVSYTHLTLPTN